MEKILDSVRRECRLSKNSTGTYDLTITGANGNVVSFKNITFKRAVYIIENNFYQNGRDYDSKTVSEQSKGN